MTVAPGFYMASAGEVIWLASCAREKCRRCDGLGTIKVTVLPDFPSEEYPEGTGPYGV
jgi:hypothetical protein